MSLRQLYGVIVGRCGVDPNYFFDEMTVEEALAIIDVSNEDYKNEWVKTRAIMHAVISSQSTKPIKPLDILIFPWEKDVKKSSLPTKEDMEMFREYVKKNKIG